MNDERRPKVVVLDYGSGNLRSAQRALEAAGGDVEVTANLRKAARADGLVIPGVGAFAACMAGIRATKAPAVIDARLRDGAPVLGICVGAQVMFESGAEHAETTAGLGHLPGAVTNLESPRVPHMGWNTVNSPVGMALFQGLSRAQRFYFVHSYAAFPPTDPAQTATCDYGRPFVAAASLGALSVTQFHPEKSGPAGLSVLSNWMRSLK